MGKKESHDALYQPAYLLSDCAGLNMLRKVPLSSLECIPRPTPSKPPTPSDRQTPSSLPRLVGDCVLAQEMKFRYQIKIPSLQGRDARNSIQVESIPSKANKDAVPAIMWREHPIPLSLLSSLQGPRGIQVPFRLAT